MSDAAIATGHPGHGSKAYSAYVLGALMVIYTFDVIDRILLGIVQERIRLDLHLNDFQLGLVGGTAFAIFYSLIGIPIARLAERANRISIVAVGAALWCGATTACGFAQNFLQLTVARIGVGVGEAALLPPSHSVLSDYFPSNRRASALAIFGTAIPIGILVATVLIATVFHDLLQQPSGWRWVFWILGAPGILAALLLKLTVKEPPRDAAHQRTPGLLEAFKSLSHKSSFWHTAIGGAFVSVFAYSFTQFLVSFLVRSYGVDIGTAALAFGGVTAFAVASGMMAGGFLSDRLQKRHPRVLSWLPALGIVVATPLYLLAFTQSTFLGCLAILLVAPIFHYLHFSPMFTVAQTVAEPRVRATASALVLLIITLIGSGLGPPLVGAAADYFASSRLAELGLTAQGCAETPQLEGCAAAGGHGLRMALIGSVAVFAWSSIHFWLAGRTMARDRVG